VPNKLVASLKNALRPCPVLCAALLLLGSARAANPPRLPSEILRQIVQGCEYADRLTSIPFPCLVVQPQTSLTSGFAVVPVPDAAAIMLVPTERLSGIESPELLADQAPNWWKYAWEARHFLIERTHGAISRNDIALAINSRGARSQDQLHIHIGCVKAEVVPQLHNFQLAITDTWSRFPVPLASETWHAIRVSEEDLESNPFKLLADMDPAIRGPMADWGMAVIAHRLVDGSDGFLVFGARRNEALGASGAGGDLIDPECKTDRSEF
jgi:CDP-diacylglycerol pyrophosphatase